jgi:template-activating factor I
MSKRAAAAPLKGHQAKKAKVEPEPVFDPKNEDLVKAVQAAQDKFTPLETEMELKLAEIEYEYENKKKPIYEERKKAIAAVPKFWSSVLKNHPAMSVAFDNEIDQELVEHLVDVDVQVLDKHNSTKITFTFSPNAILEENTLWKQATVKADIKEDEDEPVVFSSSGVKLKAGKKLDEDSFFNFFTDNESDADVSDEELISLIRETLWNDPLGVLAGDEFGSEEDDD